MSNITDTPDPIEVNDFKFLQLRKLKLVQEDEGLPADAINLVAASSRYGLVFVGIVGGFKVLKLENILDLDEDKEKLREPSENYSCQKVPSATPVLLSLSSDDMTLAVCIVSNARVVADMYDIRAFADMDKVPVPFLTVQLSSHCTELCDFMWNPVVVEKYSFCLGDGSLHVHEIVDTTLNIIASLPAETGATSVCWSPKGKQVVVGKKDGSFSQYKPTLQEAKKVPPLKLDGIELEVLNICWLTTTSFAVVYVPQANDKTPTLVLVTTAKGADVTYTLFGDVCLGFGTDHKPRYTMYHQPEWGILICASANAVETAVIGCLNIENSTWVQWALEDGGRAEMPIEKYVETYPLGMSLIFCAQRRIVISDTESYPPMPIIFLLSTSGILCPFHVLNLKPGAVNHVFPSEPICIEGERKRNEGGPADVISAQTNTAPFSVPSNASQMFPTNSFSNQALNANIIQSHQPVSTLSAPNIKSQGNSLGSSMSVFGKAEPKTVAFGRSDQSFSSPFDQRKQSSFIPVTVQNTTPVAPSFQSVTSTPKVSSTVPSSSFQSGAKPSIIGSNELSQENVAAYSRSMSASAVVPTETRSFQSLASRSMGDNSKGIDSKPPNQDIYASVIIEEIQNFEKELEKLKKLSLSSKLPIGSKEEMTYVKKNSLMLQDFHNELAENIKSLNLDTHNLKTASLESYALLGEANSRNIRKNDPKYVSMVRDRPLDIMSAKRMRKIRHLSQYLSTQLQEVHDKLDRDLVEYLETQKKKQRNKLRIPSTQAIYQTVVNNQNIIHNLRSYLDHLNENYNRIKQINASKDHRFLKISLMSAERELDKLADVLLEDKTSNSVPQKVCHGRKKLPPQVQSALREALSNHRVTCVRPKDIIKPSQSQVLSSAIFHHEPKRPISDVTCSPVETKADVPVDSSPNVSPICTEISALTKTNVLANPVLEVKPLSAFTIKSGQPRIIGGITQGTPVARPTPNTVLQVFRSSAEEAENKSTVASLPAKPSSAFTQLGHTVPSEEIQVPSTKNQVQFNWKSSFFNAPQNTQTAAVTCKSDVPATSLQPIPNFSFGRGIVPVTRGEVKPHSASVIKPISKEAYNFSSDIPPASSLYEDITPPSSPSPSSEDTLFAEGQDSIEEVVKMPQKSDEKNEFDVARNTAMKLVSSTTVKQIPFPSFIFSSDKTPDSVGTSFNVVSSSNAKTAESHQKTLGDAFVASSLRDGQPFARRIPFMEKSDENIQGAVKPIDTSSHPPMATTLKSPSSAPNLLFTSSTQIGQKAEATSNSNSLKDPVQQVTTVFMVPTHQSAKASEDIVATPTTTEPEASVPNENVVSKTKDADENAVSSAMAKEVSQSQQPITQGVSKESFFRPANAVTNENTECNKNIQEDPSNVASTVDPAATLTTKPVFGSPETTSTSSFQIQQPVVSSSSPFNQTASTTTAATPPSFFGQNATTSSSSFFGTIPGFSTTSSSVFGQNSTTTSSFFTQPAVSNPSPFFSKPAPVFGQATVTTATTTNSVFGQPVTTAVSSSPFGQVNAVASPFSQPSFGQSSSPFGQNNVSGSPFGSQATSTASPFGQAVSGFFTQAKPDGTSAFGAQSASGFSFGKTAFGQTSSNSFGLAKAVFGQPANQASGPFGQPSDQSLFGQSSFFGGLGGKPSEQNASKNVFGSVGDPSAGNTNTGLFGNRGASSFGSKSGAFSAGSFSTGGGSVSQSGFGSFQQSPQKSGGFGSPPSFGGSATFGGSPSFGSPPTFGSAQPQVALGGSPFGTAQASFSNFAAADAPTFGSLASQSSGFASLQQGQTSGFGQQPQGSVFGGGSGSLFGGGGSPSTFGGQPSSFGSSSSGNSSAFTQWRN